MYDTSDPQTVHAIRRLRSITSDEGRPIVFWLGAGVGRWRGYVGWEQLGRYLHSTFVRESPKYDKKSGTRLLGVQDFPEVFQLCRDSNRHLYNSLLTRSFAEAPRKPVFDRLVQLLARNAPLQILTTNVDESLEKQLECTTIQRSDMERLPELIQSRTSFICKLHGSISSVETTVFTRDDYLSLTASTSYLRTIESILSNCSVIFLGYGLRDKYVLDLLAKADAGRPIFGAGPHFAATLGNTPQLPPEVLRVAYLDDERHDHRGALQVVDVIVWARRATVTERAKATENRSNQSQSAYFISSFLPPGSWTTSQHVEAAREGQQIQVTIGPGFIASEVPFNVSTAMHDLAVGLICFDLVYLPFSDLTKIHDLLSSQGFWTLVDAGLLRFVHIPDPAVIFPNSAAVTGGDIAMIGRLSSDGKPVTVESEIRRALLPGKGHEQAAQVLFDKLAGFVTPLALSDTAPLTDLVRGSLIHPPVQKILGISQAFLPTQIPRWHVFPALRLANLILAGYVCQSLKISAARVSYGGETLVGAAFSVAAAQDWADDVASYVLSGGFSKDLGEMIFHDPQILTAILQFRDTQEGVLLRERVRAALSLNEGTEFIASVNAGLQRNIPTRLLEQARNQLSGLLMPHVKSHTPISAVWNNVQNSDVSLRLWRARSLSMLKEHCEKNGIGPYDPCPCGSGENLKFCCLPELAA